MNLINKLLLVAFIILPAPITWSAATNPWPNTQLELKEVCEIRIAKGKERVTYGINEYSKGPANGGYRICRQQLVCCKQ